MLCRLPQTLLLLVSSFSALAAPDISSLKPAPPLAVEPYLQALSPTSVAVHWSSTPPAYGWVEYGEPPDLGQRRDRNEHGLRAANVTRHHVVLTELQPGTRYLYRVHTQPIRSLAAYQVEFGPEEVSPVRSFETLPSPDQDVAAIVFNDLHNNTNTFALLRQAVGNATFDFSIFNGDCLADPAWEGATLSTLNVFLRGVQADAHPAFLIRGNHETRGAYARHLPGLFSWPGARPYFAFTAGPVRWVVLDCGEDKADEHPEYFGLVDFTRFRGEETVWLRQELASADFRSAPWRVLVHHIPLYSEREDGGGHAPCSELWGDLLAQADIDLALNGHTHHQAFHPAHTIANPYPIAIGGGPTPESAMVMHLAASSQHLSLRMLDTTGREIFPTFHKNK